MESEAFKLAWLDALMVGLEHTRRCLRYGEDRDLATRYGYHAMLTRLELTLELGTDFTQAFWQEVDKHKQEKAS